MKKKDSKNIIFCKDKKHMDKMIEEAYKWFSKVNPEMDIYSVYHGKKNDEEELKKIESFEVLEELREVFDTLNDIEDMLQTYTSKEYKISLVEEFYEEYGRL